ncbi:MAG: AAA family ATPase [Acidimicrobiia bacterium]|nr:AAA family ATPase [Acidimicrobiia bacterium]
MSCPATEGEPDRVVVIVGTGTEVGKTWATCVMAAEARSRGRRVAARKPAQSYKSGPTDADLLAAATSEQAHEVCPAHRWYRTPMAPPMAAAVLGRPPFTLDQLVKELRWPAATELGFVETAGGVRSPLAEDGDSVDFAHRLQPTLTVLVADAALGTINATRLAMNVLASLDVVVLLNRYDASDRLHRLNRQWLEDRDGLPVVVDPLAINL